MRFVDQQLAASRLQPLFQGQQIHVRPMLPVAQHRNFGHGAQPAPETQQGFQGFGAIQHVTGEDYQVRGNALYLTQHLALKGPHVLNVQVGQLNHLDGGSSRGLARHHMVGHLDMGRVDPCRVNEKAQQRQAQACQQASLHGPVRRPSAILRRKKAGVSLSDMRLNIDSSVLDNRLCILWDL